MAAVLFTLATALPAIAQEPGRIAGRVVDAETGIGLAGVELLVEVGGSVRVRASSGVDGRFVLAWVPAGTATLEARYLGYAPKRVSAIEVPPGGAARQDVALEPEAVVLEAITATAEAERGSVARALDAQRTAVGVTSSVTADQISKSPDGDAAAAVRRGAGVTVQDGKYVQVRGLGERYTTTSLNGARLPSPEPERKVVPLDLFPSGLLETVTTYKTFTPDRPGDFSGAQVDIRTREFPARRYLGFSFSMGLATATTGRTIPAGPAEPGDWLALGAGDRALPASVREAGLLRSALPQAEMNELISSFRNVWSAQERTGLPNVSLGASLGGNGMLFGRHVGYVVSGTYSAGEEALLEQHRARALPTAGGGTEEIDRFEGRTGRRSVLWGGLANLSVLLGSESRLVLDAAYNRTADREARSEAGLSENLGRHLLIDRLRYVERGVGSVRLGGEHQLGDRHRLDWSVAGSGVVRLEPDRSEIVYTLETDPATGLALAPMWLGLSNEGAVRTFGELHEEAVEVTADYRLRLGRPGRGVQLKTGLFWREAGREADNRAYSIVGVGLDDGTRQLPAEELFDGRFTGPEDDVFELRALGAGGFYTADDQLAAGYAMADADPAQRLRLVAGVRLERSRTVVRSENTLGDLFLSDTSYTDLLPAGVLTVELSETQILRASASRTVSRPEYRELAGVVYRDVIGGDAVKGNPELRRATVENYDLRWEWYPRRGEVVSVAGFAKRFHDPIERVYLATSGTRIITFLNARSAENYGIEAEVRKELGFLSESLGALTVFANGTLMRSEIRIAAGDRAASRLNERRPMVGQAPYVLNAGLSWGAEGGSASATLLYNVVGRRIVSAGEAPLPDVYEEARHALDLSIRVPLSDGLNAKLDTKNLLDSPFQVTQGSVTHEHHRVGRSLSLGLSWRP